MIRYVRDFRDRSIAQPPRVFEFVDDDGTTVKAYLSDLDSLDLRKKLSLFFGEKTDRAIRVAFQIWAKTRLEQGLDVPDRALLPRERAEVLEVAQNYRDRLDDLDDLIKLLEDR